MKRVFLLLLTLLFSSIATIAYAGDSVLNYQVFAVDSYAPYLENPYVDVVNGSQVYNSDGSNSSPDNMGTTVLASGTVNSVNHDWGSGTISLGGTNRSNSTAIRVWGYFKHPGTAGETSTVYFAGRTDDGFVLNIGGTNVIQDWQQQGPSYWNNTGSWSGVGGQWYAIEMWWYEWGGHAVFDLHYSLTCTSFSTSCMTDIPSSLMSTTNAVEITSSQTTIKNAAMNASIENGCNVCIIQVGDNPTINIQQDGEDNFIVDEDWSGPATVTGDNLVLTIKQGNVTTTGSSDENGIGLYINGDNTNLTINQGDHANDQGEHRIVLDINGNSNVLNLTQYDGGTLSRHFFEGHIDGGSNNLTITQKDNGQKTFFLDVNGNSNEGTFIQEDTGTHYLDVTLDADHEVNITQRGSGNHGARVNLDGHSTDFDLIQQGSTAQYYNLDNTCSNALGCTINTTQGTQ